MSEDRSEVAREQGITIQTALNNAKLKMVSLTQDFVQNGGTNLSDLDRQRRVIEALEYALTCVPPGPARVGRVSF
ncbi:hypothetical protein ACFPIF_02435 [Brevundimonas faecalis]|uniref:hypothetical protein n=1 Tax=Brevundimonas faecalis TaxID=947378 RepID=UPI003608F6FF